MIMQFSIVFEHTGDAIPFDALNPEVIEYYVDRLQQSNLNRFYTSNPDYAKNVNATIDRLHQGLQDCNSWLLQLFDQGLKTFAHEDYLDQNNLNYLHAAWVNVQSLKLDIDKKRKQFEFQGLAEQIHDMYPDNDRFPLLGDVASKIGTYTAFAQINAPLIHGLEESFSSVIFKCSEDWIEFANPFPKQIITLDSCNLFLPFNHLGRTQHDKFVNFDHMLEHNDENTFNELLGFIGISLAPPQTKQYSKEYIEWCKQHDLIPSGERLPLGNIPDLLTNLKKYRTIVLRNTTAGNNFRIELYKG